MFPFLVLTTLSRFVDLPRLSGFLGFKKALGLVN